MHDQYQRPAVHGSGDNPIGQGRYLLGTVQLGLPYGRANQRGMPTDAEVARILHAAAEIGASHLDTARAYGSSEDRIGAELTTDLRDRLGVVTKVRPIEVEPTAHRTAVRAEFDASVEESLRALRTDTVAALLLHRSSDLELGDGAVREALRELRAAGVAALTGASVTSPDELLAALADPEVGYVQLPFNLLFDQWLAAPVGTALATRPEVVVTVRSVFLQGLLVGGHAARWPAFDGVDPHAVRDAIDELVAELDRANAADLCVSYVLGHPWVDSVVLGAESAEQVVQHGELLRRPPMNDDEKRRVRDRFASVPARLPDPSRWGAL